MKKSTIKNHYIYRGTDVMHPTDVCEKDSC